MAWTGRYLVTVASDWAFPSVFGALGVTALPTPDADTTVLPAAFRLERVGVIVTPLTDGQRAALQLLDGIVAIEPEPTVRRLQAANWTDTDAATWGVTAVRAPDSPYDGTGTTMVILDSGCDAKHPLWSGREIKYHSLVEEPACEDDANHGTSCLAIAAGGSDGNGKRIGIASGATVWMVRIEGNGDVPAGTLEAAIDWAIGIGATVISISYGNDDEEPLEAFVQAGAKAAAAGCIIVAAAGNEGPATSVGQPANSSTIRAIGAIDKRGKAWPKSSPSGNGTTVDAAAPGAEIRTAIARKSRYGWFNGTSAAAPHAAGIVALWAQASEHRGDALWGELAEHFEELPHAARSAVGGGLITAPMGVEVLITLSPGADVDGVMMALSKMGAINVSLLPHVGVIRATVRKGVLAAISAVQGVTAVEPPKPVRALRR